MSRLGTVGTQYFDDAGDPLISGKLWVYEVGTTTAKNTYADQNLTILNTNPVILTAAGRQPNIFYDGVAKVVLTDSNDVQIEPKDDLGVTAGSQWEQWDSLTVYATGEIVVGTDGKYYKSLTGDNQGGDPVIAGTNWSEVRFVDVWSSVASYSINDEVKGSDGNSYKSQINGNIGNDPVGDAVNWSASTFSKYEEFLVSGTFTKDSSAKFIRIDVVSGGGSGATKSSTYSSGGSGGSYASVVLDAADVAASETVTIGAGGVHAGTGTGVDGGSSSVGSLVSAYGGLGGNSSTNIHITKVSYAGAVGNRFEDTTANIRKFVHFNANSGFGGSNNDGSYQGNTVFGGAGGSANGPGAISALGGDGGASSSGVAGDGQVPGGGGGTSSTNTAGNAGDGGDGRVRIWQW